jgi:HSP20 family protein
MAVQPRLVTGQLDPLRELDDIRERMRGVLEHTFTGLPQIVGAAAWAPLVDVEETEDAFVLEAELPGVKPKDVSVELQGSELVISGELKERERKGTLRRRARPSGRFEYRVSLGQAVEEDRIEASLTDGVLSVQAPKAERARRRRIEVKTGRTRGSTVRTPARRRSPTR